MNTPTLLNHGVAGRISSATHIAMQSRGLWRTEHIRQQVSNHQNNNLRSGTDRHPGPYLFSVAGTGKAPSDLPVRGGWHTAFFAGSGAINAAGCRNTVERASLRGHPRGRVVGFPEKWPLAQLLPTCQRAFPVTTGPKLRVPAVSGKPHRKMPNKAVLLKAFRKRFEVSRNLMILGRTAGRETLIRDFFRDFPGNDPGSSSRCRAHSRSSRLGLGGRWIGIRRPV